MNWQDIKRSIRLQLPPENHYDAGPGLGSRPFEALPNILPVVTIAFLLISGVLFYLTDVATVDVLISKRDQLEKLGHRDHLNILAGDWWGILSSAFFHGGILHFIMNAMALLSIGAVLEKGLGSLKTLALYLSFAIVSAGYQILVSGLPLIGKSTQEMFEYFLTGITPFGSSLGLSGILFAIVGFMWGSWKRWTGFLSIFNLRTLKFVFIWQMLCFIMTWTSDLTGAPSIANTAHISGLFFGFCVGMWMCYGSQHAKLWLGLSLATIFVLIAGLVFYHFHFMKLIKPFYDQLETGGFIVMTPLF